MHIAPYHLYKYKALSTERDICRTIAIIEDGTIYAPKVDELNDPFEGLGVVPGLGYAGVSLPKAVERTPSRFKNDIRGCRILSLTETPVSPQMWAYYAGCYTGACLQINPTLLDAEPMRYATKAYSIDGLRIDGRDGNNIARARLLSKHIDWSHEQEWRVICTGEDAPEYISLGNENPSAVILGHKCANETTMRIREACSKANTPLYQTYISDWKYCVRIVPFGFEPRFDGTPLEKQVRDECSRQNVSMFEGWD